MSLRIFVGWLLSVLAVLTASAQTNRWQPTNGPYQPQVRAIAVDPNTPNRIFIATSRDGLYKSEDAGRTWNQIGPPQHGDDFGENVQTICFQPGASGTLFLANSAGLMKSTDGGENWRRVPVGSSVGLTAFTIHPTQVNLFLAGTWNPGALRSADGGISWVAVTGLPTGPVNAFLADPVLPTVWYAAVANQGIWRSLDAGVSWAAFNSGGTDALEVYALAASPPAVRTSVAAAPVLYAGAEGGVYQCGDRTSWTLLPGSPSRVFRFAFQPGNPQRLAVADHLGIHRSDDGGATWKLDFDSYQPPYDGQMYTVQWAPNVENCLYAGGEQFWISPDSGKTWKSSLAGFQAGLVTAVVANPKIDGTLYAAGADGLLLHKSINNGGSWTPTGFGAKFVRAATGTKLYVLAQIPNGYDSEAVLRSDDGGETWHYAGAIIPSSYTYFTCLALSPLDSGLLWTALQTADGLVFNSLNSGKAWTHYQLSGIIIVTNLVCDPSVAARAWALAWEQNNESEVLMKWENGTWTKVGDLPASAAFYASNLLVCPSRSLFLFGSDGGDLYRSQTGARNWIKVEGLFGHFSALASDPNRENVAYLAFHDALVMKSCNFGQRWEPFSAGLPNALKCHQLSVDPRDSNRLYLATNRGVYAIKVLPGDLDGDGRITPEDQDTLRSLLQDDPVALPTVAAAADLDSDGQVTAVDLVLQLQ